MRKCTPFFILIALLVNYPSNVLSQNFDMTFLDDSIQSGPADPMIPIIFHFEAENFTDSTFHVDMYRSEVDVPEGWETALCTEACFPPEVSEAVFFMDEMAIDEASFYFYPSSVGSGTANILFVNREDSTNYYQYTVYANSEPLSIDNLETRSQAVLISQSDGLIQIQHEFEVGSIITLLDISGKTVLHTNVISPNISLNVSHFPKGIYFVKFEKAKAIKISIH